MLDFTARAEVDGQRFDGVDLFLALPHTDIDATDDELRRLADSVEARELVIGSLVAPVWPGTGGGSAMGSEQERAAFLAQVRKACRIGRRLRELGVRPYGIIRIDSASSVGEWLQDPDGNQRTSPRPSAPPATSPATTVNASPPRARSAGAACTAGGA
jgi:hypothetical protein